MQQFYTTLETKAGKEDDRTVEFIATKEIADRDGEILMVKGIQTTNYKKNPVVLWAHERGSLPVAKAVKITKSGETLKIKVQFATPEEYGFADTVYKLVKGGYLGAVSLGFMPDFDKIEYPEVKLNQKVWRIFHKVDLLEMSIVPIPANQEALSVGKALEDGIIDEVEKKEWDMYCKNMKFKEKSPVITPEGSLDLTSNEAADRIDELEIRIVELETEIQELSNDSKTYLKDLFKKDTSSTDKEDQTDEDELTDEDAKEILSDMGLSEEETQNFIEEINNNG